MSDGKQSTFLQKIFEFLSALQAGDFSKKVPTSGEPDEAALSEKLQKLAEMMTSAEAVKKELQLRHGQLENERLFIQRLSEVSPMVTFVMNMKTRSNTYMSPNVEQLIGYRVDEIVKLGPEFYAKVYDQESIGEAIYNRNAMNFLKDGETDTRTIRLRHKDGHLVYVRRHVRVFERDAEGVPVTFIGMAENVTEEIKREQELTELVDSMPVQFAFYDHEEKNLLANKASGEFFGRLPSEMRGKYLREIVGHSFYARISPSIQDVLKGQHKIEEQEVSLPFGPVKRFLWSYIPKVDDGKVAGFYVSVSDVTEMRKAQGELEQLIAAIEEVAIVDVADVEGRIVRVNKNFCDISGYSSKEIIGRKKKELNAGLHTRKFSDELESTIHSGKAWIGEMQGRSKQGSIYWVQSVVAPIFGLGGKISKFIAVKFNITAEKLAQQKLVQSSRLASLGEMAGSLTHEINNPLTIIQGKAAQMRRKLAKEGKVEGQLVAELLANLEKVENTAMRIAKIIHGLRIFAQGNDNDPFEQTNVSQIVSDTLELCREKFRNHGVNLRVNVPENLRIECRPSQLSQIIFNLIYNSLDAVENFPEKWVEIAASLAGEQVVLTVTDSGKGIPSEIAEKVMNPFFTTKSVGKGTGLGLSIAKGIAESHHGSLEYDPNSPNTRFVLKVAVKQPTGKREAA